MSVPHFILALLMVIVWGLNFIAVEVGLRDVHPITLCFARFFIICFPAIFFVRRPDVPFRLIIGYGLLMFTLQFSLLFAGMHAGISAGIASLVLQFHVFFTVLLALFFLNEKLHVWQILGAVIAFAGISLIGFNLDGSSSFMGFLLILTSSAFLGLGNIVSKKMGKVNTLALIVWASLIAWPPLLLLAFIFEGPDKILLSFHSLSWESVGAIAYIILGSTLFGYGVWSWLLGRYPVTTIAPFTVLIPVVALLSSTIILGESLDSWKIIAGLLIIGGFCINIWIPQLLAKKQTL